MYNPFKKRQNPCDGIWTLTDVEAESLALDMRHVPVESVKMIYSLAELQRENIDEIATPTDLFVDQLGALGAMLISGNRHQLLRAIGHVMDKAVEIDPSLTSEMTEYSLFQRGFPNAP